MPLGRSGGGGMAGGRGFTYNFGFAIARSDIRQLGLLTGSTLSLTTAIYGLAKVTEEYVDTLKKSQLFFGGQLRTMKAMQFAQQQLLKGATEFSTSDIMQGMMQLQSAGIDAAKNFKFMSDAAQATGQSFSQFSGAVSEAIAGNMSGMVQMGLLTQRATRQFDKYYANTVMRQQAIMNFIKTNKGLQAAITNSFSTISGVWRQIIENIRLFAQNVMGDPRSPTSLYGRIVGLLKSVREWFSKHSAAIQKAATAIGMVLGWIIKQVGHFINWVGRQAGKALDYFDKHMKNFKERMYSLVLTLELWKVHILSFFEAHKEGLKKLLQLYAGYQLAKRLAGPWKALGGALEFIKNIFSDGAILKGLGSLMRISAMAVVGYILIKNWKSVLSIVTSVAKILGDLLSSIGQIIESIPGIGDAFKKAGGPMAWMGQQLKEIASNLAYLTAKPGEYPIHDPAEAARQRVFEQSYAGMKPFDTKKFGTGAVAMRMKALGIQQWKDEAGKRRYSWEYVGSQLARQAYQQPSENAFQTYVKGQLQDAMGKTGAFSDVGEDERMGYANWLKTMASQGLAAFQDKYESSAGGNPDQGGYSGVDQFGGNAITNPLSATTGGEGSTTPSMVVQKGAVQINVYRGDEMDIDTLARKIPDALKQAQKKAQVRSGNR